MGTSVDNRPLDSVNIPHKHTWATTTGSCNVCSSMHNGQVKVMHL